MIDYNSTAYKIAISMYNSLDDSDPNRTFDSIDEIYAAINSSLNTRQTVNVETLNVNINENGSYIFDNETITGYKPVNITVDVPTSGGGDVPVVPSGSGYDFTVLGYSQELSNELNAEVNNDISYSLSVAHYLDNREGDASWVFNGSNLVYAPYANTSKIDNLYWCFASSKRLIVLPLYDFSNVTNMEGCFQECTLLKSVPFFDTGKVTNMNSMFSMCNYLENVPTFNTQNVTTFRDMFTNCFKLQYGPEFNTENATDMHNMFWQCQQLISVPAYNTSKVTDISGMFQYCGTLKSLPAFDCSNVTNADAIIAGCWQLDTIAGFINLGMQEQFNDYNDMSSCPQLTRESMLNIMNNLYDRASAGYSVPTIQFPFDAYPKLSEEDIAIATTKGWNITV